jgi:hypothetical protein
MAECEFFTKSWRKPDHELMERCSLTGKGCYCEGLTYLTCTRRTFALEHEKRHQARIKQHQDALASKYTVICSEDQPQLPLPGT